MTLRSNCVLGASASDKSAVACSASAAAAAEAAAAEAAAGGGGRTVDVELSDAVLESERAEAGVGGGGRVPSESGLEAVEAVDVALAEASEFSEADGPSELPIAS
jgi:hypothetical protein